MCSMDILVNTSNSEPPKVIYYREKKEWGQISDLKFCKTYVCEEDLHVKPC